MILRQYGAYIVKCDVCDEQLGETKTFETWDEAHQATRAMGWKTRRDVHGAWENVCTECP